MTNSKAEIAKKLLWEFRWALGAALLWTGWSSYDGWPKTPVEILTAFFTSLFFLSWFFGQFNRVDKQFGTEKRLKVLDDKVAGLVDQLAQAAKNLEDSATGGTTYPFIEVTVAPGHESARLDLVTAGGGYIIYNLYVRIRDHDRWNRQSIQDPHGRTAETDIEQAAFVQGTFRYGLGKRLTADRHDFDIRSWARNGRWLQRLAIIKIGDRYQAFSHVEEITTRVVIRSDPMPAGHGWPPL